jgi:hypothetical protein
MYKEEIIGKNTKEHLFSPPLSFAPSRSDDRGGSFILGIILHDQRINKVFIWLFPAVSFKISYGGS